MTRTKGWRRAAAPMRRKFASNPRWRRLGASARRNGSRASRAPSCQRMGATWGPSSGSSARIAAVDLVAHDLGRVVAVEAEVAPEQVEADAPAGGPRVRLRLGAEDDGAARAADLREVGDEADLPMPASPPTATNCAAPRLTDVERGGRAGASSRLAADERRGHAAARLRASVELDAAHHLEHLDGLGEPLDVHGAERARAHAATRHGDGVGAREHGAGLGELLEARREVHGLPHCGDRRRVGAERPQHDLAGVEAHADQDGDPVRPAGPRRRRR